MSIDSKELNPENNIRFILLSFLSSRIIVFTTLVLSALSRSYPMPSRGISFFHTVSDVKFSEFLSNLKSILLAADASWYMEIANYGYPIREYTNTEALHWVFFPLFPFLVKVCSYLTGSFLISALIINFLSLLLALLCINSLMKVESYSNKNIKFTIALICFHPLSYFYSAPFTEALFLLLICSSLFFISKGKSLISALIYGLCIVSRPTGLLIAPGIGLLAKKRDISIIPFTIISAIPFITFCCFLGYATGNPLAWLQNQSAWGRKGSIFDLINLDLLTTSNLIGPWSPNFLHLISLLVLAYALSIMLKNKNWAYCLIALSPTLSAISSGTLLSVSRLIMPLVIIPMIISKSLKEDTRQIIILCSAFLLGIMTLLYSLGVSFALA